jgi:hypothetical protein
MEVIALENETSSVYASVYTFGYIDDNIVESGTSDLGTRADHLMIQNVIQSNNSLVLDIIEENEYKISFKVFENLCSIISLCKDHIIKVYWEPGKPIRMNVPLGHIGEIDLYIRN